MDKILFVVCCASLFTWCQANGAQRCNRPNEEKRCVKKCPPEKSCDNRKIQFNCFNIEAEVCMDKCVCKKGYVRNYLGECVSEDVCDKCKGQNEFFTCGPECDNECDNPTQNRTHCDIINVKCNDKCYCKDNYARDESGVCVPKEECGAQRCNRPNEEKRCVKKCPPEKSCDNRKIQFNCFNIEAEVCTDKCVCKKGYVRNYLGECVSEDVCDKCKGQNEFFTCGPECDNECDNPTQNRTHCDIINVKCNDKCYCKDNYARDECGVCVPKEECGAQRCNRPNEEKRCVKKCPPEKSCDNRKIQFNCFNFEAEVCTDKCVCKKGYVRNYLGECVSEDVCEKCKGQNEFFTCGPECDNECDNPTQNRTHCDIINKKCNEKCYCKDNYARDECGVCVPKEECDVLECNGVNEEKRCVFECPPERTCDTRNALFKCGRKENEVCKDKCVCKKGYYRNYLNECISEENCAKCEKNPNEFFTCGPACDNRCASLDTVNRTNCDVQNVQCNEQCYCKDGFARDVDSGICIPKEKCSEGCPGPHEVFVNCKPKCPPDTCASMYIRCAAPGENNPCSPGCKCQENFLRQKEGGPCMPIELCRT